ncbi:helix-turn-helix transcriptional regulator [Actinokineospora enzanensis]|uniref:helix-turn-helix transcriptional regulator n=1 Tax=Actinokineospora enzanensis TaxID=155975 RepID=UPI000371EF42|nr:helix-turn-helix transcriptional regulator [Actinokineospora enzanensis]
MADARRMAGFTQEGLAEALHVERSTVHRWESGKSRPQPYLWPRLAKLLDTTPARLRDLLRGESPEEGCEVDRRSVLQSGISVGVLLAIGEQGSAIDPRVVDTFVDLRDSLVAADSLLGPGNLVRSATEQVDNVSRLYGRADRVTRGRLFEIGALFAELCGWLADDLGGFDEGKSWSRRALEWAHASGNADVVAFVVMRMSQQAHLTDDRAQASALAFSAIQHEHSVRSTSVRAALHQQAAHASALDGDEITALQHVDTAFALSERKPVEADPYSLACYCVPAYVTAQRAAVLSTLGLHRRALDEYDRVLGEWPQEYHREKGLHLARRTSVAALAGLPDAAVESGVAALGIARGTRSRRTMSELAASAIHLEPWRSHAAVAEFLESVAQGKGTQWR